jgi:hypothetical protein
VLKRQVAQPPGCPRIIVIQDSRESAVPQTDGASQRLAGLKLKRFFNEISNPICASYSTVT